MLGLMQNWPLLVSKLIEHADKFHGKTEIVTLTVEGGTHRYTWSDCHKRSKKVAQALQSIGVGEGDIIGTLAWNTYRHVELWYGISGMGAVAHTINPRLFKDQLIYIANHAEDKILFLDTSFVPIIEAIADELPNIEAYIIMTDEEHMPKTSLKNVHCYETLLAAEDGDYAWPELDENLASGLCYTSGTTGNPKGVLYSHRSNFLHTLVALAADALGSTAQDVFFPVVPMFHANAWGVPYCAAAVGCKLALAGPNFDGETIQKFIEDEGITLTAAVPTVWLALLGYLQSSGKRVDSLKRVIIGGSAAPRSMIQTFEDDYGVEVCHAWGMTETSPLGSVGTMTGETVKWEREAQLDLKCKQGRPVVGVEMEILDDDGNILPHDGKAFGHLVVRGPWVVKEYMKAEGGQIIDENGWFDTGDVSTLDELGFMQITDRSKDVIKSGGEWISSIELENAAVGHPDVAEAGVIGVYHPKWNERPLLILVLNDGASLDKDSIMKWLEKSVAKWWLPDDIITVDELPHTATGKILKMELRETYKDYKLPTA
jgi:fatty-acyl-CoA synthase